MKKKVARKLNIFDVNRFLQGKSRFIFSPLDLQRYFKVNYETAKKFIFRGTKKGIFLGLKRGLHILTSEQSNQYMIANCLYKPSYISFDTALSFYGIIPETIYSVTSATTSATRQFKVKGINYTYQKLKRTVFTGYNAIKYQDQIVLMAEPEKALADYLYFVELKKRQLFYERLNLGKINKRKLLNYVKLFEKPNINNAITKIYDEFRKSKRIS